MPEAAAPTTFDCLATEWDLLKHAFADLRNTLFLST